MAGRAEAGVCAGCLSADAELRHLSPASLERALPGVQLNGLLFCWICAAEMRHVARFRHQVELSLRTLADYFQMQQGTGYDLSLGSMRGRIQMSPVSQTAYPDAETLSTAEVKHESALNWDFDSDTHNPADYNMEVKVEINDSPHAERRRAKLILPNRLKKVGKKSKKKNDPDDDIALSNLRKSIPDSRKLIKDFDETDPHNKGTTVSGKERLRRKMDLDPNKIRQIFLTHEELMEERLKDSQKSSYLKFQFRCEDCIQGFDFDVTYEDHMRRKHSHEPDKFQCDVCKSVLSTPESYKLHCQRHLVRYECMSCGKRAIDKPSMVKHYAMHHDALVPTYVCGACGAVSRSYRAHRYHKEKHKDKPQCEDCGKTFINKNTLRAHILNIHQARGRRFPCPLCSKVYRCKSGLHMHASATHARQNRADAFCTPCQAQFKSVYSYLAHLRTSSKHLTEEALRFKCADCGARFLTKRRLQEHVDWEHLKITDNVCTQCNKTYKHRMALERHRKYVHDKVRPKRDKICDHCGRAFTTTAILRSHVRTHTGERPLHCGACPAAFSHPAALYTHNKLVHLKKPREPSGP